MDEVVACRDYGAPTVVAARAILGDLVQGWVWILIGGGVGFLIALGILNLVPPEHTAMIVIGPTSISGPAAMGVRVPVDRQNATNLAEHPSGSEEVSDFARYLHLLTSQTVARRLLADATLMHGLFADRWDPASQTWRLPSGPLSRVSRLILAMAGRESWVEPDADALTRLLTRALVVESVGTGAMRRIRFRATDPAFARSVLSKVTAAADDQLREEARHRIETQIAFIRGQLGSVVAADHRRALVDLQADQERMLLLIGMDLPFAADIVEVPVVSALPDWPNAPTLLAALTAVGVAVAAFAVGAGRGWRSWRRIEGRR